MRREVTVNLGESRSYPIFLGEGLLPGLGGEIRKRITGGRVLVVTNPTVWNLWGREVRFSLAEAGLAVHLAEIPDGEEHKTLETAARLYDRAFEAGLDRSSAVVALGGGVVGDIGGFVAATYMRGVAFVQVPTTLLAQVDSSVGGKVAVNHPRGKNIIGAFYQPVLVLADVGTLRTLPSRELRAGIAEVIKYGVISDAGFFGWLEDNLERLLEGETQALTYAVEMSCRIKARVVEADETEQGRRRALNYGHTFGHALEALSGYRAYVHGEAVAVGMVAAAKLSVFLGLLDQASYGRIERLVRRAGLPADIPESLSFEAVWDSMQRDKKTRDGRVVFVLPESIGRVGFYADLPHTLLRRVLSREGDSP
ncbi:MAG: 3-dehydroquinate synthase [Bacillota bacterium]